MSLPVIISGAKVDLTPGPDRLVVESETNIGIGAVRAVEKFLQRKPYAKPVKTVVIVSAEKLTLPAQQALLKTLEEPPANSRIILLCANPNQLLPTIVSRCLLKRSPETAPRGVRLEKPPAEAAASPEAAKEFVINQLRCLHQELRRRPETANVKLIKALNLALAALKVNVNPKLTLDVLSLYY